jgi:hypothetical protein
LPGRRVDLAIVTKRLTRAARHRDRSARYRNGDPTDVRARPPA